MLEQYNWLLDQLAEGHNTDIVFLDFSKAFDRVDHSVLLRKLSRIGIGGSPLNWFRAFLAGRNQKVRIGSQISESQKVRSGVPQGSVLGPLMFLVYISDLGEKLDFTKIYKYVDDTKCISSISEMDDVDKFKGDLEKVYNWAEPNCMAWNSIKFHLLRIGNNENLKN